MANEINNLYEFADLRFDGKKGKLWRNGDLILLSPKASELLELLLERNGEFVSKEEIFERIWTDTFVEDGVLTQNIYTLRKALGKNGDGQRIIENKVRLGYRITVPISTVAVDVPEAENGNNGNSASGMKPLVVDDVTEVKPHAAAQKRKFSIAAAGIVLIALIGSGLISWLYFRSAISTFFRKPIERVKFTKLTNTGDLTNAVISPDGSVIAFTRGDNVYLKDIATEKEIKLDIPNVKSFSSLQFSPDGNLIYFRNNRVLSAQTEISKVSRFGGESQPVIERSWGSFSISPDGKRIAYFQNVPPVAKFNLKIRDLETGEEREYLAAEQPQSPCAVCAPAWSPDGSKIIFSTNIPTGGGQLFIVDLAANKKEEIKFEKLRRFEQAAWLPDGDSFIVSATEGSRIFHLWKVYYPDGEIQPVTNGLSAYGRVTISFDGKSILAMQTDETSNIFVANSDNLKEQKQLTTGSQNSFGQNGLHWVDERRILYSTQTEQNLVDNLAILNIEDGSKTQVTNDKRNSFRVPVSDGKRIWFTMNQDGSSQIFQMDIDGKNIRQLTEGNDGLRQSPRVDAGARYLYYVVRGKDGSTIRRIDLQSNAEETVFNNPEFQPGPFLELSPDNKYLTFTRVRERTNEMGGQFNAEMAVVSVENGAVVKVFPVSMIPPIRRFSPDGKSIDWIYAATDGTQIVRQAFDADKPIPIYTAPEGEIFNFAWSKSGKQLAVAIGQQYKDAVLLTEFDK